MALTYDIPSTMKAIVYHKLQDFSLEDIPVPQPKPHEVLIKVKSCGVCGTDLHIHDGDFASRMPVVTGHETSGIVVKIGSDVSGFKIGDKVTADNSELCGYCHYCRRGQLLHCENFLGHGVHLDGGFAEYCVFPAAKLFHFHKLSWIDASLFEAASCAIHGLEQIGTKVGSKALLIGSGPTGLCLAQLLRHNGGHHVVVASNRGAKMDLARKLECGDEYVDLERDDPEPQWEALKKGHPYGFDVVIEASGSHQVAERAMEFVAKGGKLMYYGVYKKNALVNVSPSKVFGDEITIVGSFSQMYCLQRSVDYLEAGKVRVDGIVDKTFKLEQFGEALDAIRKKQCIKACIVMD
ncbi:hypothetical protein CkaCkLH20_09755 [Colletotrichum karsti]|uniref:Enoyl reductase (ER) domain-containing protein n=1 Tax=Colletotrichum karsti TaxID=1095194 RepID=A0A9P6HX75_9PEZI|nr:uncharacterized protein CkaCkLH20_09755 [Colletotrichum karsti]KAF9872892.1 hypothetical protein CkaCkLH20_09755 [Colletotrichum karsti]